MRIECVQEEASSYFLSRQSESRRSRRGYTWALGQRTISPQAQNPLSTPIELSRPAFRFTIPKGSPVIRGGYLFSDTGERTRLWRDWLRREIHRRHPGVLYHLFVAYRASRLRFQKKERKKEREREKTTSNFLNKTCTPVCECRMFVFYQRHLYFAQKKHIYCILFS